MAHADDFAHKDYLKHLLKLFLIHVQRNGRPGQGESLSITSQTDRTLVRFRQALEQEYRHRHTVQEYADLLSLSSKTLSNCVQERLHTTPLSLINDRIVLEAKRLLAFSDMKSKEVGYYLGFTDPAYFSKFFKRQTGISPSDFKLRER